MSTFSRPVRVIPPKTSFFSVGLGLLTSHHSLANCDSCPTPAKSEAIEYLQVGPTEIRYSILGRYLFIYSVVSVNRNIVRYNKYLVVVTVVVVLSVIVIVIVISLEHSTVVVGVFKFKFEYPIYSIFREKV